MKSMLELYFSLLILQLLFFLDLLLLEPLIRLHLQFTFLICGVVYTPKRASYVAFSAQSTRNQAQ